MLLIMGCDVDDDGGGGGEEEDDETDPMSLLDSSFSLSCLLLFLVVEI